MTNSTTKKSNNSSQPAWIIIRETLIANVRGCSSQGSVTRCIEEEERQNCFDN